MHRKFRGVSGAIGVALASAFLCANGQGQARAEDADSKVHFGAFGSLGATYHRSEGIEFRRSADQPHGAMPKSLAWDVDSLLGVQGDVRLVRNVDLVIQAISRQYPNNSWSPRITWGFLRFTPDESLTLRLGRVGLDAQVEADSRYIGYSYLPIRPSQELLATIPVDHMDGGDITWSHPIGEAVIKLKGFAGRTLTKANAAGEEISFGATDTFGAILGYMHGDLEARIVGGQSRVRSNGAPQVLIDTLRSLNFAPATISADALDTQHATVRFLGAAIAYASGPLTLQSSYLRQSSAADKVTLPKNWSMSLLAGYRFGSATPFIRYGKVTSDSVSFSSGLATISPLLDATINTAIDGARINQRTVGIGMRYDFADHFALKAQIDHVSARQSPLVLNPSVAASAYRHLTVFGVTLDFAF